MISVRNHLPLLSGNKWFIFLGMAMVTAACSPKLQPVKPPVKVEAEKPVVIPPPKVEKPLPPRASVISLILPFGLDHLNPGASYSNITLKQANLAVDYYQGFKLALDSLTAKGYNYKLLVHDSRGLPAQAHALAYNPQVRASDLIVGPVFPEDLKAFTSVLVSPRKSIVSPLSPASPAVFNNPNLITVTPPLVYHAWATAKYIRDKINPQKIFILKSGYSEDNGYITPFKNTIDTLSKNRVQVIQLTVVRGNLAALSAQLSATTPNIFIMPSTNQAFLMVTMRSLDSVARRYPVILFGHPGWAKFNFLHADILQRLRTHITSADKVDYKAPATLEFLRAYRKAYHTEPGDYAIKGFDEGLFFGGLLGAGAGEIKNLETRDFTGLHNTFHFIKKPGQGYINIHINMMDYRYFELRKVE